jgi:hypothetical protein
LFNQDWPRPKSRTIKELNDPILFLEVLHICQEQGVISTLNLMNQEDGLRRRFRGTWSIGESTLTTVQGLISAMLGFRWLDHLEPDTGLFILTEAGLQVARLPERQFRRVLAEKMQERYVIPGLFIALLYCINSDGGGEVILPAPLREWQPEPRKWQDTEWNVELREQALTSARRIKSLSPKAFPANLDEWIEEVEAVWNTLGKAKQKRVAKVKGYEPARDKPQVETYSLKSRLSLSMRDASIKLLFDKALKNKLHSSAYRRFLPPRSFFAWCSQLDSLEFLFYTDYHPSIAGRVIVPCCAFRSSAANVSFEEISSIVDPQGRVLHLYQPKWNTIKRDFVRTLIEVYLPMSKRIGSRYISVLDVRDEVCRQLRLSAILFDSLLETSYQETIREEVLPGQSVSISLESDIRPDEQKVGRRQRRPVFVQGIPHTLIAIANTPH